MRPSRASGRDAGQGSAPEAFALDLDLSLLVLLALCAFGAGLIDAVVGGGGLIQVPALFTALPQQSPATLFGTNKLAAIAGTSMAVRTYLSRVRVEWAVLGPAFLCTLVGAWFGARTVAWLPRDAVRPIVLVALVLVAVYTLRRKGLGDIHAPLHSLAGRRALAGLAGLGIGFYDGFLGPGTGTFFIFCFVRLLGYDFLSASACAKVLNWASNFAALAFFVPAGHVIWPLALTMAAANMAGGWIGSRAAIARGSPFVRRVFIGVLVLTIGRFGWDTLRPWLG